MTAKHWTEEELLAHLYGIGPDDDHIRHCADCAFRLESMQARRRAYEARYSDGDEVGFEFLAAQRRRIYERISSERSERGRRFVRRFAPALAASLVVAGGLMFYEQQRRSETVVKCSDTQLVEDVGQMAMNPEPAPVAPLRALFVE